MKKLLLILLLIALIAFGYFGFHRAPDGLTLILSSRLQGKKVLEPGQWTFIPESMIPGWVSVEKISALQNFQGKTRVSLPCFPILSHLALCHAEAQYQASLTFKDGYSKPLYQKSLETVQKETQALLEEHIQKSLFQHLKDDSFSAEVWTKEMNQSFSIPGIKVQYSALFLPDWKSYVQLSQKMDQALNFASEKELVTLLLENQKKNLDLDFELKKTRAQFEVILEMAGKISKSPDKDLILKLLQDSKGAQK